MKIYQVDAFTSNLFEGNPAAVCPLSFWPPDELMQKIAMENNLAETCFYVQNENHFEVRWFTPTVEVDLCGHATLAAAHVLFHHEHYTSDEINFFSPRSGMLGVSRKDDRIALDFPTDEYYEVELSPALCNGFNLKPQSAFKGKTDYMLVFKQEEEIASLLPFLPVIAQLGARGVLVTAPGSSSHVDFVSRFFAPQSGIDEDPVTGSAHTTLAPYWAQQLGKNKLSAIQLSKRRGYLECIYKGGRVEISGRAKTYLVGEIEIE